MTTRSNHQDEQLYQLVAELHRPKELYHLIQHELPGGRKLVLDMPEPDGVQTRLYAGEVIAALERRGRIDQHFFHALARELMRSLESEDMLASHPDLEALLRRLDNQAEKANVAAILSEHGPNHRIRDLMAHVKTL